MRGALPALCTGLLIAVACASGFEPNSDDVIDPTDARVDAPFGGGDGGPIDARIDAPGTPIDAPVSIDAPTGGGVDCPNDITYYLRAIDALSLPSPPFCTSGPECTSAQCCYGGLVCVPYP